MPEITEKTVTTTGNSNSVNQPTVATQNEATTNQTVQYLVYFLFGVIEALLAFRFFLKLTGASLSSGFVQWIYNVTGLFVMPFEGVFRKAVMNGTEVSSVFEPATILAIAVYALLAFGIVKLIIIFSGEKQELS